jgi:prepilin-type N-terminal cleavage/methylation domain-containing protein
MKTKDNEMGFTLLEVIVAISVFTVGLLAVASMQVSAIRGSTLAGGVTEATSWLSDQMEKLMVLPFDHAQLADTDGDGTDQDPDEDGIDNNGGDFGLEDTTAASADHQANRGRYTLYWNIALGEEIKDTKTVNIIVTWTDHGIQKRISMKHIVPNI